MVPLLYLWGDDDLVAARLVARFEAKLAEEAGAPLERWDLRAALLTASDDAARLHERLATATMFGGGTVAIVTNPGVLVRSNADRDTVLGAIATMAPGNALVLLETTRSGAKGPGSTRLAKAIGTAHGRVVQALAPNPGAVGAWIEGEARERGIPLGPGVGGELAERLGTRVREGDVERRHLTRIASMELDKLALRHASDGQPISRDDVRELVAETTPASIWALSDAIGNRKRGEALAAFDRVVETTPEPVLLVVLHRRVVELLELGDRLANGEPLPAAARAMGIKNEFRAKILAAQARQWRVDELSAALAGLVELDAAVKGVPGSAGDEAQRRLAFTLWIADHATGQVAGTPSVGKQRVGPG
jgi:DNA polymerase III delta subunit